MLCLGKIEKKVLVLYLTREKMDPKWSQTQS
jgi:hypothetical protein